MSSDISKPCVRRERSWQPVPLQLPICEPAGTEKHPRRVDEFRREQGVLVIDMVDPDCDAEDNNSGKVEIDI